MAAKTRVSLQKQEQIQAPENAPIARFDGLCCYQTHSENNAAFQDAGGCENPLPAQL